MTANDPQPTHQQRDLTLRDVALSLNGAALFPPLNINIGRGEIVTVMGPSGCGKSSLLAFVSGALDDAFTATGDILIGARRINDLPPERRRVGIQFQDDLLFPHLSVAENLLFALDHAAHDSHPTRAMRRDTVIAALDRAGLAGFADRDPATLSGGQRARIALTRTLLAKPDVLLLDEPFNKLDATLRGEFREYVFRHARDAGLPTLLVTHDAADANAAGGTVIELGRVQSRQTE
jgi:putative thiamine transport system ATP-binding protein